MLSRRKVHHLWKVLFEMFFQVTPVFYEDSKCEEMQWKTCRDT